MARVLVVDDEQAVRRTLGRQLRSLDHELLEAPDAEAALARLRSEPDIDVVLSDVRMPGGTDGNALCRSIQAEHPELPVLVMTGFGSIDAAVAAIRAGAWDFLRKPFGVEELDVALRRALEHRTVRQELRRLRRVTRGDQGPAGLVGASPPMQDLFERIERVGATAASVLILGPSGVGKERVARGLHEVSPRASGPFVALNCAALPEHLVESELFGHAEGAFTGAGKARKGLFRAADGGTLFLDEVGDLSLPDQARLLRALEERRVRPVGQEREVPVDVRFIAATNIDLAQRVEEKAFRADLYYRLRVVALNVPPLAERGDDVLLLAAEFLEELGARDGRHLELAPEAERALLAWTWPGNVRELRNAIEGGAALSLDGVLTLQQLPPELNGPLPPPASGAPSPMASLADVERRHILRVIRATDGNRSEAARILGIDRKTLLSRLKRYGLSK